MEPAIIYETEDMLVANKPSGLLTHPASRKEEATFVSWLVRERPEVATVGEDATRPGIVHRLDRETSGLLVVAKTQEAYQELKQLFHDRIITKHYYALVYGVPVVDKGIIEKEIAAYKGKRRTVEKWSQVESATTRSAVTRWSVEEIFGERYTLLDVAPKTGRTHQIRVHLASIGHPIVCDTLYAAKKECPAALGRLFLHAYALRIPRKGELIDVDIPLTDDLTAFLGALRTPDTGLLS